MKAATSNPLIRAGAGVMRNSAVRLRRLFLFCWGFLLIAPCAVPRLRGAEGKPLAECEAGAFPEDRRVREWVNCHKQAINRDPIPARSPDF